MPEGHVIHRLARDINEAFAGQTVAVTSPQGRFHDEASSLTNTTLDVAEAMGKHLFLGFESGLWVWIHLGLIGKFRFVDSEQVKQPKTLRLRLDHGSHHLELRGPQWCRLVPPSEYEAALAASGPDPLRADADPSRAWKVVAKTRRTLGALLMDQSVFAGVGNIYRAEVLFRHGIDPMIPGCEVSRATFDSVWDDLVVLMAAGVDDQRIDTVAPEHMPEAMGREPRIDRHGGEVYVYRRAGDPCFCCGSPIAVRDYQSRKLYWCPECQREGSAGSPR